MMNQKVKIIFYPFRGKKENNPQRPSPDPRLGRESIILMKTLSAVLKIQNDGVEEQKKGLRLFERN